MKKTALVLVIGVLLPAAAMASEATPREHCLQKIARKERVLLNAVARSAGSTATPVMLSIPMVQMDSGSYFSTTGFGFGPSMTTIIVPSEREVMARELRVLDWHKGECARLPASGALELRTKVSRGGGTRRLKIVQP